VDVLGDPALMQYKDPQVLFDKRDEIHALVQQILMTRTTSEWLDCMLEKDLWVSEVLEQTAVPDNPQVKHNRTFVEIDHPRAGKLTVTDIPFRMSRTPGTIRRPPPLIGEHGREILTELGYDEATIDRLIGTKVISIEKV
jgi:crotonobetainyl-CoA:carnitine CoA-transferase CaiB-like acyl-CoA transferase